MYGRTPWLLSLQSVVNKVCALVCHEHTLQQPPSSFASAVVVQPKRRWWYRSSEAFAETTGGYSLPLALVTGESFAGQVVRRKLAIGSFQ